MNWYERLITEASHAEQLTLLRLNLLVQRSLGDSARNEWAIQLAQVKTRELYPARKQNE